VWVYFLKKKEILLTSVRNVAARSYYYSFRDHDGSYNHSVEKLFSKIEDRTSETFRSLETAIDEINLHAYSKGISETDRRNLMEFLFLHMIRVPAIMDYIRQESAKHETSISKEYGKDYSEDYVQKNSLRVLTRIGRNKDAPILDYLLRKDCRILSVLRSKACFLTTDNPVRRLNKTEPDGIFHENTEIYLPLKMLFVEKKLGGHWRKVLAFADERTAQLFKAVSWHSKVVEEFGVEVMVVSLEPETRRLVLDAQKRQKMKNVEPDV